MRRKVLLTVGGLVLLLLLSAAYIFASGPIHLPMLARFMAEQASIGPAKLTILDASLDFTHEDGIRVVVREAHLRLEGEVQVEVILPRVEAPLDAASLLSGNIHFESLKLDRPKIILGVQQSEREVPEMAHLMEAINRVADVVDEEFARRNLAHVEVSNGEVEITGALARSFAGIDASVQRHPDRGIEARARVAGRLGPWELQLVRSVGATEADPQRIAVLLKDVTIGELLSPDSEIKGGRGLGIPVSLRFESRFSSEGTFEIANLVGRSSNGWFQLGRSTVRFDDIALALAWSQDVPGIRLTTSHAIYGNTQIFFGGRILPPETPGADWHVTLNTERAQFGSSDIPLDPISLDGFGLSGRFVPSTRTFFFDTAELQAGPAKAFASGSIEIRDDGPYIAVAMEAMDLPVGLTKQIWPITLVPPARRWIIEHVHAGRIESFSFQAAVRPPAFDPNDPDPGWSGDDLTLKLGFADAEIDPVGEVPHITGIDGTVTIADEVLTVAGRDGKSVMSGEDVVTVPEGIFKILRLRERDNKLGVLDIVLEGRAKDLGDVVDSAPFRVLERADVSTRGVTGDATLRILAEFPMHNTIDIADIEWSAQADATNFTTTEPIRGHTIAKGNVHLDADRTQIAITGKGVLDGLPADINLLLPLGGSGVKARQGVVLTATAEQLKDKGIDLTAFLGGSMTMTVEDQDGERNFEIDLTKARVRIEALGWEKASGVPATTRFRLIETDEGKTVQDFELTSDGVDVAGSLQLAASGELENASFSRFRLRAGDDASLTISRGASGRYKVAISGEEFDARGLIRQVRKPKKGPGGSDFANGISISANLTRVKGFNGINVESFAGIIATDAKGIVAADVTGMLKGRAPFSLEIDDAASGVGRTAVGAFDDAGALLKFLDVYDRMRGGNGRLNVAMEDHDSWTGSFSVTGLSITEDPAIQKLRERPQLFGREPGNVVKSGVAGQAGEASFETLELAFVRERELLTITRGALQGAVIGGTVTGTVDLDAQSLDLTGTFVPIFALNNIFAKIPILGFALGGGSQEGLIGVTYQVRGSLSDPVLSVNPISAIAPGIFRKMFEFQ